MQSHKPVLLFDIDGTLLAIGGAGRLAMLAALCDEFSVKEPKELPFSGRTDRHLLTGLLEINGYSYSEANVHRFRTAYSSRLQAALSETQGQVLPGVTALLGRLNQGNAVRVGVLTGNLPETAEMKLRHHGLWDFFELHFFGDKHLLRPELMRYALAELRGFHNYAGDQICVIGDTPLDIEAARAIGARSLATATGNYSAEELAACKPTHTVCDLGDTDAIYDWLIGDLHPLAFRR